MKEHRITMVEPTGMVTGRKSNLDKEFMRIADVMKMPRGHAYIPKDENQIMPKLIMSDNHIAIEERKKGCICSGKFVSKYNGKNPTMLKLQRGKVKYPGKICRTKSDDLYPEECILKDILIETRNFLTSSYVNGEVIGELVDASVVDRINNMDNSDILDFIVSLRNFEVERVLETCIEKYHYDAVAGVLIVYTFMTSKSFAFRKSLSV